MGYRDRLVSGHNFLVFFGPLVASFAKVSGLENQLNVETLQEGGVNHAMVLLQGPPKTLGTVVFEHGQGSLNPLSVQFEVSNNFGLFFGMPTTILIFDNGLTLRRAVGYNGGVPVKWSLSELNALEGHVVIDRIEVRHQGIFNVPI